VSRQAQLPRVAGGIALRRPATFDCEGCESCEGHKASGRRALDVEIRFVQAHPVQCRIRGIGDLVEMRSDGGRSSLVDEGVVRLLVKIASEG
jgi:hypothetical protein